MSESKAVAIKKNDLVAVNGVFTTETQNQRDLKQGLEQAKLKTKSQAAASNELIRSAAGALLWSKVSVKQLRDNKDPEALKKALRSIMHNHFAATYPVEKLDKKFTTYKSEFTTNEKESTLDEKKPQWGSMPITAYVNDQASHIIRHIAVFGWDEIHLGSGKFVSRAVADKWVMTDDGTILKTDDEKAKHAETADIGATDSPIVSAQKKAKTLFNACKKLDLNDASQRQWVEKVFRDMDFDMTSILRKHDAKVAAEEAKAAAEEE